MPKTSKETIIKNKYRTHTNNQLRKKNAGETVRLSGWVHSRRDHGGLIFIDIRDKWGITQLTFNPQRNKDIWEKLEEKVKDEFVISVSGQVAKRPKEMINSTIKTGEIEVEVETMEILGTADALPFIVASDKKVNEELRLKYRFLDLRHPRQQKTLKTRDKYIACIRDYMHRNDFTDVQTPILANSSPEGARDYLVPSRLHPGHFYALPQAPQQYKQLLMTAGLDRYFQIAPCFRDEDPRADRHPGVFYQLDMEMSFVEQADVLAVTEKLMIELTGKFSSKEIITQPFPQIPWREAMARYGSDKPDLRYDLFITNVSAEVEKSEFKVFSDAVKDGGVVHALHIPGGADFTRTQIDKLTETAKNTGAKGLACILIKDEPTSPIIKFLGDKTTSNIIDKLKAKKDDAIFFGAGQWLDVCQALGAVRRHCAKILKLDDDSKAAWCWIVDFPMYEENEDGKIDFSHNPFSMPKGGMAALSVKDSTTILGQQYDLALNGSEISSGAIRNHDPEIMYKAFAIAGYKKEEVNKKFSGMIKAFKFGAPPHGGNAPGIDRLFMILLDLPSIRDVYAFPKYGKGQDLLMGSPSPVDPAILKELHIKLASKK